MRVLAPFLAFLFGGVLTLQGCSSCDTDELATCTAANIGTDCATYQTSLDCWNDCCDEDGASAATAAGASAGALFPDCTITDPCA